MLSKIYVRWENLRHPFYDKIGDQSKLVESDDVRLLGKDGGGGGGGDSLPPSKKKRVDINSILQWVAIIDN